MLISFPVGLVTIVLSVYHGFLISVNQTTRERLKAIWIKATGENKNPHAPNKIANCFNFILRRKESHSWTLLPNSWFGPHIKLNSNKIGDVSNIVSKSESDSEAISLKSFQSTSKITGVYETNKVLNNSIPSKIVKDEVYFRATNLNKSLDASTYDDELCH